MSPTQRFLSRIAWGLCLLSPIAIGGPPPKPVQLEVRTLAGSVFRSAEQRGKWLVVNYWATWCAPCVGELSDLSAFQSERVADVVVLGLAFENTDEREIRRFLRRHPVSFTVAHVDPMNPPEALRAPIGLPTTYLISPQGLEVKRWLGPVPLAELRQAVPQRPQPLPDPP